MSSDRQEPSWPEQPSPSYPRPPAVAGTLPEGERATIHAAKPEAPPRKTGADAPSPASSPLAKEYADREALQTVVGKASYYSDSLAGNHTASGEVYEPTDFTAAHRTLPFGTIVRVTRKKTGDVTYVRINDRGPFVKGRVIDLSKVAARELDMLKAGVTEVKVEILSRPKKK